MDEAYRNPADNGPEAPTSNDPEPVRFKGPRKKCPACGEQEATKPKFCRFGTKLGWFKRCQEPGSHMHQACKACGCSWTTNTVEEV